MTNLKKFFLAVSVIGFIGLAVYVGRDNSQKGTAAINHNHQNPVGTTQSSEQLNDLLNKSVPSFSLTDRDGKVYSSDSLKGKNVVMFFNEGLMCYPACWNQIAAFGKDERFKNDNTVVLSVVVDPKEEWQKAIDQMPELAAATVVFDKGVVVSKKFGTLTTASSMHYGSLPGHTYILIDKEGIVRHIFDDPNMALHNDQLTAEITKLRN